MDNEIMDNVDNGDSHHFMRKWKLKNSNACDVVDKLVAQYERLFGKASHEVCKDAVQDIIAEMEPEQIPNSLK